MFFNNIKKVTCHNCGEDVPEDYFKCPNCGSQLICELNKKQADFGRIKQNTKHGKLKVNYRTYSTLSDLKTPKLFWPKDSKYDKLDYIYGAFNSDRIQGFPLKDRPSYLQFDFSADELLDLYKEINNLIYDFLNKGEMCMGKERFNQKKISYLDNLSDVLYDIVGKIKLNSQPENRIEPISRDKAEKLGLYKKASKPCSECNI